MKKLLATVAIAVFSFASAQIQGEDAFSGQGDTKAQIGANFQRWGTGIQASIDYGLGESFSVGLQGGYVLGFKEIYPTAKPSADQRFDLRARANAHLGDVIGFPQNVDLYPGLDLGLKNFGAHAGIRYFFGNGFGVFAETQFPIARFNKTPKDYQYLNNQFNIATGVSFNLTK